MSRQQVLLLGIAVTLIGLFLVGCGSIVPTPVVEVSAATDTPESPAVILTPLPPTPTPEPPTTTPTPSITGFGQAAAFEGWQMKVVSTDQVDSLSASPFTFQPDEGYVVYLVELELENTADTMSTLTVDPQKIEVIDTEDKTYMSLGGSPGGKNSNFLLHVYQAGGSASMEVKPPSGDATMSFTSTAKDEKTKEWMI